MSRDEDHTGPAPARRITPSNARARLFFAAFFIACAIGLTYTFIRPAVYVSTANVIIAASQPVSVDTGIPAAGSGARPAAGAVAAGESDQTADSYLLTEMQRLSGLPVISGAAERLKDSVRLSPAQLQDMLQATHVPGTNVVQLHASGHDPKALPVILNAWIASYLDAWGKADNDSSSDQLTQLKAQTARLKDQVDEKRAALDRFRIKYGIASMDSNDNEALAKLTGLNKSLSDARNAAAQAESTLQALQDSIAAGQPVVLSDDKQALTALEQHANDLREQLAERRSGFTPQYMALDKQYQSMKDSLARIERQIKEKRQASQAAALDQARQAVVSARDTVARLTQQQETTKQSAMEFTSRFAEHKSLQDELDRLEGLYSSAQDRLVALQAAGSGAQPQVSVLDRPAVPTDPVSPAYSRDAAISVGAAVVFALLTVWFVEFLNRSGQDKERYPVLEPRIQIAHFPQSGPGPALRRAEDVARLAGPGERAPRELSPDEVAALLEVAQDDTRLVLTALLSGLPPQDLTGLRWDAVVLEQGVIRLLDGGTMMLRDPLKRLLAKEYAADVRRSGPVLRGPRGDGLSDADLDSLVLCAAHDAGLNAPADVDARALRHTYIAYLVRQGIRLGDLAPIVGSLPPSQLAAYGRLSPPGRGRPAAEIDLTLPALGSA